VPSDLTETAALLEVCITADGGIGSMGEPLGVAPDLVEAYVGLGRTTDAADLAERYAAVTPKPAPPPTAARTRLLYGARLRRAGQRVAAGATARPRRPLASEPLTSQETRVALLVARGLPKREIAAALFLSPRTVEHHLASVFRKRGFRSRTEVAAAFATADPAQK